MKRPLPAWAKVIVALVVASFVGVGYSIVRAVSMIRQMSADSVNPEKQSRIAERGADFPIPLPEGFSID